MTALRLGLGLGLTRPPRPTTPGPGAVSAIEASSPDAWWSADSGITEVSGGVSSWVDQATNALDLTQTTAASRPAYSATAMGGRPGLVFDDVDDYLRLSDTTFGIGSNDFSFAVVYSHTSANAGTLLSCRDYVSEGFEIRTEAVAGRFRFSIENTSGTEVAIISNETVVAVHADGTPNIIIGRADRDGLVEIYTNGGKLVYYTNIIGDISAAAGDIDLPDTPIYVGASGNTTTFQTNRHNGPIAKGLIWGNRLLSDAEINAIGDEWKTEYGVGFIGPA